MVIICYLPWVYCFTVGFKQWWAYWAQIFWSSCQRKNAHIACVWDRFVRDVFLHQIIRFFMIQKYHYTTLLLLLLLSIFSFGTRYINDRYSLFVKRTEKKRKKQKKKNTKPHSNKSYIKRQNISNKTNFLAWIDFLFIRLPKFDIFSDKMSYLVSQIRNYFWARVDSFAISGFSAGVISGVI